MKHLLKPLCTLSLISCAFVPLSAQNANPGPYEILPFQDAYIIEAFCDLPPSSCQIADWSGWTASQWESPNAYDNHGGTDFSASSGTPVYAAAAGTVTERVTNIPQNGGTGYGNYVKIAATGTSPKGEAITVITAHLLPTVQVTVGQNVTAGQLIGYSDNTGNSTSEHCHVESALAAGNVFTCPLYHGHYKYPIMFNPNGKVQVGHVIKVKAATSPIRSDRFESSSIIANAHEDQLYFASFAKRGFYRVFIPNDASNRSGWIKALDVAEVMEGTVIHALPDSGAYVHTTQLAAIYPVRAAANTGAAILGNIRFGGGRFVADQQAAGGWYRVPVPGAAATWG